MSAYEGIELPISLSTKGLQQSLGSMDAVLGVLNKINDNCSAITGKMDRLGTSMQVNMDKGKKSAMGLLDRLGQIGLAIQGVKGVMSSLSTLTDAYDAQIESETKLAQVMRNTMGATDADIQSIKDLASAQQQLGVIGDEVQLAGAQELATYLEQKDSLQSLIPVMNNMVAQQYGLNASQESAVGIATMLGKVMEGQTSALSRYGYSFDEAQKKILETGTEMERVATLAEVVNASVGGVNETLAQTDAGRVKQLANTWGDVQEQVGGVVRKIEHMLLPIVETMLPLAVQLVEEAIDLVPQLTTFIEALGVSLGTLTAIYGSYITYLKIAWLWEHRLGLAKLAQIKITKVLGLVTKMSFGWIAVALGAVVSIVMSLIKHWDYLKKAFTDGGILHGIMAIGKVLLDAILAPVQSLLEILSNIPGLGHLAGKGAGYLSDLRKNLFGEKGITPGQSGDSGMGGYTGKGAGSASTGAMASGASSVATGGTRNTSITINMGSLVHQISYSGGIQENTRETTADLQEALLRVLNAAANTAS